MIRMLFALAFAAIASGAPARAAGYPERPITIIVPFPPGGSSDAVARVISPKLSARLGQPIVIENKAGATGAIGANFVARAKPDGYTFLVGSIGVFAVNPVLQPNVGYDPRKDFDLLTLAVRTPNVLVTYPGFPANSVMEFIDYLKKHPGKVSFVSAGTGSSDHLTAELFWQRTGTTGIHVPYKGGGPAVQDLIAGHAHAGFRNLSEVSGHIKAGKLKMLAVAVEQRVPEFPDVPTLAEAGVKDLVVYSWQAAAAPKGLPKEVMDKLQPAVVAALKDAEVKSRMQEIGFEVVANSSKEFADFLAAEMARWKTVIDAGNIKPE